MKNYTEILAENGIVIPDDKAEPVNKAMNENYKTINDYNNQTTKLNQLSESLKAAQDGLKAFDGVDVSDLKSQIAKLNSDLQAKDAAHAEELAGIAFKGKLSDFIRKFHGKNEAACLAQLDLEALRKSQNQDADIEAAIKADTEKNPFLYGEEQTPPPFSQGTGANSAGGNKPAFDFGFAGVRAHEK